MAHNLAHKYPTLAKANRLHMYSFGAPRVGNTQVWKSPMSVCVCVY